MIFLPKHILENCMKRTFIYLFKSTKPTTQRRSRLHHWYCVGVNTPKRFRQLCVTDLPKVPVYVVARVGFAPDTLRTEGTELPTEPPRPTHIA